MRIPTNIHMKVEGTERNPLNDHAEGSGNHTEDTRHGPTPKQPNIEDPNSESRNNTWTRWSKEEMRESEVVPGIRQL
jgi:hypothetical protein